MDTLKFAISLSLSAMLIGAAYGAASAGEDGPPDAAALFENKCSICHLIERAKKKNKTEKGWRDTVMRMKNTNGAPITEDEAEMLIEYLTDNYGK